MEKRNIVPNEQVSNSPEKSLENTITKNEGKRMMRKRCLKYKV